MSNTKLDLSSFQKAVATLGTAVASYTSGYKNFNTDEQDLMRDGVIQRFEYTFELSWKIIKRYLNMYGLEQVDRVTNRDLFRIAFEQGLIRNVESWFDYLEDRNQTSHIYDQDVASDVFGSIEGFLEDAQYLLARLQERVA